MKFSILIANYNNGKYFKDCYNSIINQTYNNWEAIIVDDSSTDDSVSIIKKLIINDKRFRLSLNSQNKGCGYTKNKCAQLATGEICGFLDPDDALLSNALEIMVNQHYQYPGCSLVHSSFYYCNEQLEEREPFSDAGAVVTDKWFTNFAGKVSHFATFKKSFYDQTNGIDRKLLRAVDQDLYLKLSEVGPFKFIDKVLYRYRVHNEGISVNKGVRPFYYHVKALINAENRRGVDFEEQIQQKWDSFFNIERENQSIYHIKNLNNPRYLIGKLSHILKKHPGYFFRNIFTGKIEN